MLRPLPSCDTPAAHVGNSAGLPPTASDIPSRCRSPWAAASVRLPPSTRSVSQDGYAVLSSDGPGEYDVAFEAFAGVAPASLSPGTVAYIGTGGPLPEGADAGELPRVASGAHCLPGPPGSGSWVAADRRLRPLFPFLHTHAVVQIEDTEFLGRSDGGTKRVRINKAVPPGCDVRQVRLGMSAQAG